jgi:hypothetical protein
MAEEEKAPKVRRYVCTEKRHWIPKDEGRSRRRWVVGQIYEGTDTPPEDYFKPIDSQRLEEDKAAQDYQDFMQPQTLHEQQILDMPNKGLVADWIKNHYPEEAKELNVSEDMKRPDLNHLAFKLLRKA